jgi:hypothetical protein
MRGRSSFGGGLLSWNEFPIAATESEIPLGNVGIPRTRIPSPFSESPNSTPRVNTKACDIMAQRRIANPVVETKHSWSKPNTGKPYLQPTKFPMSTGVKKGVKP